MIQSKLFGSFIISLLSTGLYYTFNYENEKFIIDDNKRYKKYAIVFFIILPISFLILSIHKSEGIVPVNIPKNTVVNNTPPF